MVEGVVLDEVEGVLRNGVFWFNFSERVVRRTQNKLVALAEWNGV